MNSQYSSLKIELKNNKSYLEYDKTRQNYLYEKIDKNRIYKIIKSEEIHKLKKSTDLINKLNYLIKKIDKQGFLKVKYTRLGNKLGRVYALKFNSYQALNKLVRNSLAYDDYIDIDIVNAHPCILNQICLKNNLKNDNLNHYIINREKELKRIMNIFNITRRTAKEIFLRIVNGGCYKTKTHNKEDKYLDDLTNELKDIRNVIIMMNDKLLKLAEKNKPNEDKEKTAFAYFLQDKENKLLEIIFKQLEEDDIIDDRQIATLCFDGLMVLKNDKVNNEYLKNITASIEEKTGFKNIILKVKDMEDRILRFNEENINIDFTEKQKLFFDTSFMAGLPSYELKKKYFELFYCKIINPVQYVGIHNIEDTKNKDDKKTYKIQHSFMNRDKLKEVVCDIKSGIINNYGVEMDFFEVWRKDPDKRSYNRIDFIPYNPDEKYKVDDRIFNLFTGYSPHIKADYNKKDKYKIVKPYLDLLLELAGGDKKARDYIIKAIAHKIKYPRDNIGIAIEIRSTQGIGKNVSTIPLQCIFGEDHFISSSNVDDFFGNHATGLLQKIIVIMDEMDIKKTYGNESTIKTLITEDKRRFNPKNAQPFTTNSFVFIMSFTNKENGLKIDFSSGDRRFVITKGTTKYLKKKKTFWKRIVSHFKSPHFISALYDYMMDIETENIDWIKERPLTEEYKASLRQFIPTEALYVIDEINNNNELEEDELNYDIYYFYRKYKKYCIKYNLNYDNKVISYKLFIRKITELSNNSKAFNLNQEEKTITIKIKETIDFMKLKKYLDSELDEYKDIEKKYNLDEEDDDLDSYFV